MSIVRNYHQQVFDRLAKELSNVIIVILRPLQAGME